MPRCFSPGALPVALTVASLLLLSSEGFAQTPLHERIDRRITQADPKFESEAAPLSSDAEFLRRVSLDLGGIIPTAAGARAFLADSSKDKRARLIDRLLASPEYARHMCDVFDVLLMERRKDQHVPREQWREYLRKSFEANKPWDQLVREILSADGVEVSLRPAAKFALDREADPHLLTRDISRLFLGMNLQCAQCHDHPLVDDYKQSYYYGLYAFLQRTSLFTDPNKQAMLAEKADGETSFQSVFDPAKLTKTTGPRVPDRPPVKEPGFVKGKEYVVAPAKGVRPVPKFSRRALLAGQVADRGNVHFRRTSANRFWALLMGRGLVHPVDFDHTANPPSHPELLSELAEAFAEQHFDIRAYLRELALSKTYQRGSESPSGVREPAPDRFALAIMKPLTPEELAWSTMRAVGLSDAQAKLKSRGPSPSGKLNGSVQPFVRAFGGRPGQPEGETFEATLDQALFLRNGNLLQGWLQPRAGNLLDQLSHQLSVNALADELYLSVLTRFPTAEERQEVASYLEHRQKDRTAAIEEMTWALLTSAEFRFNH